MVEVKVAERRELNVGGGDAQLTKSRREQRRVAALDLELVGRRTQSLRCGDQLGV